MISNEKSAIISVLNEKIVLYKDITSKTFLCYKQFLTSNIFKIVEINPAFTELEYIQMLINNLEINIHNDDKAIDELLNNLQEINDKLSITIKQFGTSCINDLLTICLGNEYIKENIMNNECIFSYYNFLNDYSHVISYEIVSNPYYNDNNSSTKNIKIKNIDIDNASFYMKIFGYQLSITNNENNQIIVINCIFKDIPPNYVSNTILNDKINTIKYNKPNNDHFESTTFDNFVDSLSVKSLMVNKIEQINEMYLGSISNALNSKSKLLSKLMREFLTFDLYNQRQMIIDLLLDHNDNENKYIAYLLYDLLSSDVNSNIDSNDQMILYNSFPCKVQNSFKYAMKSTIEYTKKLMDSDLESKLPLEQRICLLKTHDIVKEKAMIKVKELRSKSDDSGAKVRHYLEGLLKIPFGIFKKEKILSIIDDLIIIINNNKDDLIKMNIINKDNINISNIDIINIYHNLKSNTDKIRISNVKKYLEDNNKVSIIKKITNYNNTYNNKIIHEGKSIKKVKIEILGLLQNNERKDEVIEIFDNNYENTDIINSIKSGFEYIYEYMTNIDNILDQSIYGQNDVKKQIKRVFGQWINGNNTGYCFGFEGPPGVGKTSIVKEGIANCLLDDDGNPRPFGFIAIGGSSNGSTLEGHNYTYVGSIWGKIVDIIIESKCMNPIIFIDEIDKVSKTENGKELIGILTHLVDPSQNEKFQDKYFSGIDLDLSKVLFIFSYNDVELVDRILLDRIHRVQFKFLSIEDKLIIVKQFLLPELCKKMGYNNTSVLNIDDSVITYIINEYTAEAGVRKLKEVLFEIVSEINLEILSGIIREYPFEITIDNIKSKYLSKRHPMKPTLIHTSNKCGIINGLWANALGKGGIIQIESQLILSNTMFDLKLTGMQGDVMKESMSVAKSLAWSYTDDKIKTKLTKNFEKTKTQGIHIHCPEGAVPKDGPSAGTAISVCLYSLFNDKPIKHDLAITGEITLQGNVTAIGGLDLKILGGITAGVKTFLFPLENKKDFDLFMNEWKDKCIFNDITFIPISTFQEALNHSIVI